MTGALYMWIFGKNVNDAFFYTNDAFFYLTLDHRGGDRGGEAKPPPMPPGDMAREWQELTIYLICLDYLLKKNYLT